MMKMKRISSAIGLLMVSAAPLYAACGAHIGRVSDGMDFMRVQTVQHVEGEKQVSIGIEGTNYSMDITLDGREWHIASAHPRLTGGVSIPGIDVIESKVTLVAVYRADDGTMRTVDCGDIAT